MGIFHLSECVSAPPPAPRLCGLHLYLSSVMHMQYANGVYRVLCTVFMCKIHTATVAGWYGLLARRIAEVTAYF